MQLPEYFKNTQGTGVLATADRHGQVNTAIYARPHCFADGSVAMLMRQRLSYNNLTENPSANYLFMEKGNGYQGVRLSLKKIKEDNDPELLKSLKRRYLTPEEDAARGPTHVVYFSVEKALQLIGGEEIVLELGE